MKKTPRKHAHATTNFHSFFLYMAVGVMKFQTFPSEINFVRGKTKIALDVPATPQTAKSTQQSGSTKLGYFTASGKGSPVFALMSTKTYRGKTNWLEVAGNKTYKARWDKYTWTVWGPEIIYKELVVFLSVAGRFFPRLRNGTL